MAQGLLNGLYPEGDGSSPVPVFTVRTIDGGTDNLTPRPDQCPRLKQIVVRARAGEGWRVAHLGVGHLDGWLESPNVVLP